MPHPVRFLPVSASLLLCLFTGPRPLAAQPTREDIRTSPPALRGDSLTRALLAGRGPDGRGAFVRVAQTRAAATALALRPLPFRLHSPEQVAAYLAAPFRSQELKAWVIYRWLAHHVHYDQLQYQPARRYLLRNNPTEVLLRGRGTCDGQAWLAQAMLTAAGLPAVYVAGRSKGTVLGSVPGASGHAWNLVCTDGVWGNFDLTHFDPLYPEFDFLCDPDVFQRTHLAFAPRLNLARVLMTPAEFSRPVAY
jgi:transglutaminase-like putative cysteine protease